MIKEINEFIHEVEKLQHRYELSKTVPNDYFEPGMMEFLDQSLGIYDQDSGKVVLRFEVKGTRYEGRTELIETVKCGDQVICCRDKNNVFNPNNFTFNTISNKNLGHMPAELCNAIAPLYDNNMLTFKKSFVSYVEPISKRSKHAKQAILFVEIEFEIIEI